MEKIKPEWLLLALALLFLCFTAGLTIGRRTADGELRISTANAAVPQAQELTGGDNPAAALPAAPEGVVKININTASSELLESLPGIGPTLAQSIIEYRTAHGAFASVSELTEVSGIGRKRLDAIAQYITVEDSP